MFYNSGKLQTVLKQWQIAAYVLLQWQIASYVLQHWQIASYVSQFLIVIGHSIFSPLSEWFPKLRYQGTSLRTK